SMNSGLLSTSYNYDNDRRVTSIRHTNSAHDLIAGYSYGWNNMDQRNYEQKEHANGRADNYSYDSVYRLTQVASNATAPNNSSGATKTVTFDNDDVYNYRQITEVQNNITKTITPAANSRNQYTTFDGKPLSYDSNGSLTEKDGKKLSYDFENRLVKVVD